MFGKKKRKAKELIMTAYEQEQSGMMNQAISLYKEALRYDSSNTTALFNLGSILFNNGNHYEGIDFISKSADLGFEVARQNMHDKGADAFYNQALDLFQCGDYLNALQKIDKAIKYRNNFAEAHYNKAGILFKLSQKSKAIEQLKIAASLGLNKAMFELTDYGY